MRIPNGRSWQLTFGRFAGRLPAEHELETTLRNELGLTVRVNVLPAGTVPRSEVGKAVRVTRWGEGEPPLAGLDD